MSALPVNFSLPELQEQLDRLVGGGIFQISVRDYRRLFGVNDIATERLRHFARGHACIVSHTDSAILFRKQLESVSPAS